MTDITFTDEQKQVILQIARESGRNEITRTAQKKYTAEGEKYGLTFVPGGVFVTYKINGQLRGCIGCFCPGKPFYQLIQEYAIHACNDSRFKRMKVDQFDNTTISVSCLSIPVGITDPLHQVIAGKHGITVEYEYYRGTYLPQVATEQGWNTEEFCTSCAYHKAGIPRTVDVFNDKEVSWQTYTATVVSE